MRKPASTKDDVSLADSHHLGGLTADGDGDDEIDMGADEGSLEWTLWQIQWHQLESQHSNLRRHPLS